jgi:hypothetical protein
VSHIIHPDSALARAAADLLDRHQPDPHGCCLACGLSAPCPVAQHAASVEAAVRGDLPILPRSWQPGVREIAPLSEVVPLSDVAPPAEVEPPDEVVPLVEGAPLALASTAHEG